jgi:hypothetical protein
MMIHHPYRLRRSLVATLITEQVGQFSIADLGHFSKALKERRAEVTLAAAACRQ